MMLRGTTTGRMLKRDIFKTGLAAFSAGMVLLIITMHEQYNFGYSSYFDTVQVGLSLMQLMWLTSLPSVVFGLFSFVGIFGNKSEFCDNTHENIYGHCVLFHWDYLLVYCWEYYYFQGCEMAGMYSVYMYTVYSVYI